MFMSWLDDNGEELPDDKVKTLDGEIVDKYRRCFTCGGQEQWCNACQMYDCHDCDPFGTCQCS